MNRLQWTRIAASASAAALLPAWGGPETAAASLPTSATDTIEIVNSLWEVRPGITVPIRTYGGIVPGKAMHFKEGQRASVRVVNRSGESQTLHWHDSSFRTPWMERPNSALRRSPPEPRNVTSLRFVRPVHAGITLICAKASSAECMVR